MDVNIFKNYLNLINFSTGCILTAVGIIGNTLVIYILAHKNFRKIPMFRYFLVSAVFQIIRIILFWPYDVEDAYWTILSNFACKIFSFLVAFLRNYVAWIETVISIDRYVSIMHPHNLHLRDKLIFQLPILTLIFIISLGAYFPFYYFSGLYILLEQNTNYTYCNVIDLTAQIWLPFYDLIISTGIPFIIMLFTTCRVGIHLVKNKKNIKSKKELKLFKILLGMNFFFFFFYLQWLIFQLVYQLSPPAPLNIIQIFQSWYTLSQFLNSTYCSVTFFIHYCCNKQFRKYFKSMLFNRVVKKQITFGTDRRSTTAFRLFSL